MAIASVLAACLLAAALSSPVLADTEIDRTKGELSDLKGRIRDRQARLRSLDRDLTRLATEISNGEALLGATEVRIDELRAQVEELQARRAEIQAEIDQRSRAAYIDGPGSGLEMLLDASSYADLVNRVGYLTELNLRDGRLADELARTESEIGVRRLLLARLLLARTRLLQTLEERRKELTRKFAAQKRLVASLRLRKDEVVAYLSRIRPFAVCPVREPHAVADDFGAPRHAGGFHRHQGNDILAPYDTPIVAPFDGVAVTANNKLGGLAVKVLGQFGYVYNAHLSRFGTLGEVRTGDVIGYVGTSGDARGGTPHDHFEWHPGNGPAIDPHQFLMLVC